MEKRVVVTGMGVISPIGNNISEMWDSILNLKCGIDEITRFDTKELKTKLAAEVKNYNPLEHFELKQARKLDRSNQYAMIAAREAMKDSGMNKENTDYEKVGVIVSSGIGGLETIQEQCFLGFSKGISRVSPFFLPMAIANMPTGNVSIDLGLKGESISIVTACASSTNAIGEAFRIIKDGYEDAIVVGGTEAAICGMGIACFENMKTLSSSTDKNRASIPFDKERNGFVIGEGAAIVVLEELEHAKKRNAKIYGEVIGYGATSDAYHITAPEPSGDGASRAMKRALENAGIEPKDVDYINAHGTSTLLNDSTETKAIKLAFGEAANNVMVSSTKSYTGHMLGATGAFEAIVCLKALNEGVIPPTINYKVKDEECDLDIVPNEIRHKQIEIAMSNSLGFGGHNASIILKKYKE